MNSVSRAHPLLAALLWLLPLLLLPAAAHAEELLEGVHYDLVVPARPVTGEKPLIQEVFNFHCPHCYELHRVLQPWAEENRERFTVEAVPIHWGRQTDVPLRAFFAAQAMGKGEEMKSALFRGRFDGSVNIDSLNELGFLAEEAGLDPVAFEQRVKATCNHFLVVVALDKFLRQAMDPANPTPPPMTLGNLDFLAGQVNVPVEQFREPLAACAVTARVSLARMIQKAYGINGTPTLVINGRYKVTGKHAKGDHRRMLAIAAQLAERP